MMQDGRIDKRGELGFAPHDIFGLAADPRPHGIELIDGRPRLLLRHCQASGNECPDSHKCELRVRVTAGASIILGVTLLNTKGWAKGPYCRPLNEANRSKA